MMRRPSDQQPDPDADASMHEIVYTDVERLSTADDALAMNEETFRALYERTARPLWAYLARATGSPQLADDLLQEAYFRLLRSRTVQESEAHQRHYLFKIAINLFVPGMNRASSPPRPPQRVRQRVQRSPDRPAVSGADSARSRVGDSPGRRF